ncbi:hypothetical protein AMK16_00030 [Streptomyces sp. CB00455]|nr:hypothetical protein AMK16_00030 [Streptomyces sp. CB00455]
MHTAVDRLVPLVARAIWDTVLGKLADQAGRGYLFRRRTSEYAKNLIGAPGLLHTGRRTACRQRRGRLRATWIVASMRVHTDHHLIAQTAGLRAVPQSPAGARRQLQRLAALSERPDTPSMRAPLRLAMQRI